MIKARSTACQRTSCSVLSAWCFAFILVLLGAAPHAAIYCKAQASSGYAVFTLPPGFLSAEAIAPVCILSL